MYEVFVAIDNELFDLIFVLDISVEILLVVFFYCFFEEAKS